MPRFVKMMTRRGAIRSIDLDRAHAMPRINPFDDRVRTYEPGPSPADRLHVFHEGVLADLEPPANLERALAYTVSLAWPPGHTPVISCLWACHDGSCAFEWMFITPMRGIVSSPIPGQADLSCYTEATREEAAEWMKLSGYKPSPTDTTVKRSSFSGTEPAHSRPVRLVARRSRGAHTTHPPVPEVLRI
ncbi:MAG: hypothetical protein NVSMB9_22170 [Isosphaeraceae bacterium]